MLFLSWKSIVMALWTLYVNLNLFSPGVGRPEVYSDHCPNTFFLVILVGKHAAGHQQEHTEQSHLDLDLVSNLLISVKSTLKRKVTGQGRNITNHTSLSGWIIYIITINQPMHLHAKTNNLVIFFWRDEAENARMAALSSTANAYQVNKI